MKNLFDVGEVPPLGHVPAYMHAFVIHADGHGNPCTAFKQEVVPTPEIGPEEILIMVMTAGVNFNGIWAALGKPASPSLFHGQHTHIAGSDAAGIIWKIGDALLANPNFQFKVGDEVIAHCGQYCSRCNHCNGGNPMLCKNQRIWGYETTYGSFAQFAKVLPTQLLHKPPHLSWEVAGSYLLTTATAWQMLYGFSPNTAGPGKNVLVYGGAGGTGSAVIQLTSLSGGNCIAVVSDDSRGKWCMSLGAKGYINRRMFKCWGRLPEINTPEYKYYLKEVRAFGKAIWEILGEGVNPDIVVDFIGEQTFPVSAYVVEKGGMVVTCGASSGFMLNIDASYLWMRQKRLQGSHFCSLSEIVKLQHLIMDGKLTPAVSRIYKWSDLPAAHEEMLKGGDHLGNLAIQVQVNS
ncbi:crotonyl-CoA carboxylase/reductase [Chitinophaga varians]|uniref:Crotonyl-CoA carboxylase/reductase n=1 Tax=Chitinophaga varians TaxID=2202339 RepID=A0A847S4X6_9BACT|nr:crotonyl-CoA carboxylase/reductase [Chitinophaga varians]NLR68495.1 crotonyl-CoA carboxylase/reductase [Chitinophaga varians]